MLYNVITYGLSFNPVVLVVLFGDINKTNDTLSKCQLSVSLSICPSLVNTIPQEQLEGISSSFAQTSTSTQG